jgi:bisphosphoglycerate-dependent phosphoglycerate mutase
MEQSPQHAVQQSQPYDKFQAFKKNTEILEKVNQTVSDLQSYLSQENMKDVKNDQAQMITDHVNSIVKIIENLPQQQQTSSM